MALWHHFDLPSYSPDHIMFKTPHWPLCADYLNGMDALLHLGPLLANIKVNTLQESLHLCHFLVVQQRHQMGRGLLPGMVSC